VKACHGDAPSIRVAAYPRPTATLLSAVSAYLSHRGRPALNAAVISAPTKLCQPMPLAHDGLPVPATVYLSRRVLGDSFVRVASQLGVPFVMKALNSGGGRLNFLIASEADFQQKLADPACAQVALLAQRFIPDNGTFRLLVFGEDISVVMHRCGTGGTHLSNTEQGGHAPSSSRRPSMPQ
jgi:glutathione synthase/RimK-type ligase-like ATP-grasp enzyme